LRKLYILFGLVFFQACMKDKHLSNSFGKSYYDLKTEKMLKESSVEGLSLGDKIKYLDSAYFYSSRIKIDSIKLKFITTISYRYYASRNFDAFRSLNSESVDLAKKLHDTVSLALNYWDLGNYFLDAQSINDSAYHYYSKSQNLYSDIGDDFFSARMLYNVSRVQARVKDYIGSEVTLSKAIPIFKALNKQENLYKCYNSLGILNNRLGEFDKAIFYYNKALDYLPDNLKNNLKAIRIINNKGVVYENQKKYKAAIGNYKKALSYDSIYFKSSKLYAALIDNLAYSKFKLGDTSKVVMYLNRALKIRDSLNLFSDIPDSKLHLSEYYAFMGDTTTGLNYALDSRRVAAETNNNKGVLDSYLVLADLDKKNGIEYSKKHIALNDSLQRQERRIRNKFARIRFETDEVIVKNQQLSKQRYWIILILAFTILFAILGYVINRQRQRNKTLEFERQQQRANEEIYNLMLSQQSKVEEGSLREKKRISEELHDGVLGRMFGTRLTLGSFNDKSDAQSIKMRQSCLEELKSIEEEVRGISHEMSNALLNSEVSYLTLVTNLLETQSLAGGFQYKVDSDYEIDWELVSGNMKINIYRIIQESVQNINKYAQASNVYLNFEKAGNLFLLTIQDDGVGFDITTKRKGIGLKNIKSRAGKLQGELNMESAKNKGTKICIEVPLKTIVTDEETV